MILPIWASLPPTTDKTELRREMRERRERVSAETQSAAALAAARAAAARPEWARAHIVASYRAMRGELDPSPLEAWLVARGVTVVWPRVDDTGRRGLLTFHRVAPAALVAGRFGVSEPPADSVPVALSAIDAFIVPGLAFSRLGARLGWGKGHYDATLAAAAGAWRVAWCYDWQVVPVVPESSGDERVDVIVTEAGALDTGARAPDASWRVR